MRSVLIAASGTGGHVYPGIALAEELRSRRDDVLVRFAVARGKPGAEWIRRAGFETREVALRGFSRRPGLSWLAFPFALAAGAAGALRILLAERPDLVVGTGGYVSGPFVALGALLGIPTLVLEQNSIPGVATRLASLVAREVHVAFPESVSRLPRRSRAVVSGNPVRVAVERGDGAAFRRALGLPAGDRLVLVVGGSQGALALVEAAVDAAAELAGTGVTFLVQTGARHRDAAAAAAAAAGDPAGVVLVPFVEDMGGAYAAADLVVARAGAMTLAELGAAGVPSVLVPYPWAAEDHQSANARRFAEGGAATVVSQAELGGERLARTVRGLLEDRAALAAMAAAARGTEGAGARERIADACERWLGRGDEEG